MDNLIYKSWSNSYRRNRPERPPRLLPAHTEAGESVTMTNLANGLRGRPFVRQVPDSLWIDSDAFPFKRGTCERVRILRDQDAEALAQLDAEILRLENARRALMQTAYSVAKPITREQAEIYLKGKGGAA